MLKKQLILLFIPAFILFSTLVSEASWIIDPASYHVSAHGQTSCLDCHDDIEDEGLHPDPANVTKSLDDLFRYEKCLDCHDGIMESLEELKHGNEEIKNPDEYKNCLECHNPHKLVSSSADEKFEPKIDPFKQCGTCHEEQKSLPALGEEEETCMECHGLSKPAAPQKGMTLLCLNCHADSGTKAQSITGRLVPLINTNRYGKSPHSDMGCTECHINAVQYEHDKQSITNCRECHLPHDEKVAHDAHSSVSCKSCHVQGMAPVRDDETGTVSGKIKFDPGKPLDVHDMSWPGDEQCARCHYSGNTIGASNEALPSKGVLCMPCHAATFSLQDPPSRVGLIIFVIGILLVISTWLTGTIPGKPNAGLAGKIIGICSGTIGIVFSFRIFSIIKILFFDVLLQRRLFKRSKGRWFIHGMIFYPFLFRFLWGIVALIGSLTSPETGWIWPMLDKNNPVTALVFEISGILLLLGIIFSFIRGRINKSDLAGVPRQDIPALCIIAVIVVLGFILEGMRMAMTGFPETGVYAPLGLFISRLFSDPSGLVNVYKNLWYAHAGFNAIFIAYLPFSRLRHIIMAPIVLMIGAASGHHEGEKI